MTVTIAKCLLYKFEQKLKVALFCFRKITMINGLRSGSEYPYNVLNMS